MRGSLCSERIADLFSKTGVNRLRQRMNFSIYIYLYLFGCLLHKQRLWWWRVEGFVVKGLSDVGESMKGVFLVV